MEIVNLKERGWVTPEESKKIRSRVEVLQPGKEIGEHSTGGKEEIIIVLEGEATITIEGGEATVCDGFALFIPEGKVHNVSNKGSVPLRYMYVVAPL